MASILSKGFVVLELRDFLSTESEFMEKKILISTTNISSWNLASILRSQLVRIEADRNRLIEESSYFRGLFTGSFSESCLDCVSIEWNLEAFINVLKAMYGCSVDITGNNFVPLLEGALFFGVEALLLECRSWLSKQTSTKEFSSRIDLDVMIEIWSFGYDHEIGFIPELCTGYLARNFMWTMSCSAFANVPYKLLHHCIEHPQLTIVSEKHLAEGLLVWLEGNKILSGYTCGSIKDDCVDILQKVRISLLPLGFAAGKKRNYYFKKLADESITAILSLTNDPFMLAALKDDEVDDMKLRLTEFTEKIDLSGCPQITSVFLLISLLPCSNMYNISRKKIVELVTELEHIDRTPYQISQKLFPILSFEAVHEVDISNCPLLHLPAAINCFSKSFPALTTLKANYLLNFRMSTLFQLVQRCPLVNEVDLTADLSPAIPTQVSIISTSVDGYEDAASASYRVLRERPIVSNITKLILQGRSDVYDMDLVRISTVCSSLSYLNLKGCISVTDLGMSNLLYKCAKIQSLNVSDTSFGRTSVLALLSGDCCSANFPVVHHEQKSSSLLALRLRKFCMGGCKSVDATSLSQLMCNTYNLKHLCLRDTSVVDEALYGFTGCSLKKLDISNTMVSGSALAYIVKRSPGLKLLKARGCRNLCSQGSNIEGSAPPDKVSSHSGLVDEVCIELGKNHILQEVAIGWGFHSLSLDYLGPAIRSLRSITVSLGASLGESALEQLPDICPLLESVVLLFQVISDSILTRLMQSLKHLRSLALCHCLGDLSSLSFNFSMPNIRTLRLQRVTPWMTNDDLVVLTQNCRSLVELSLSGCALLNSYSQEIISHGWPSLISIHLEECGYVTLNGVSSLFDCKAVEDLTLRHNGCGIQRNFIIEASSKMPMLLKVALDLCDASEGGFDSPSYSDRYNLHIVKIAKCKARRCPFGLLSESCRRPAVHKETIVLEWNSKELRTTVVKERV